MKVLTFVDTHGSTAHLNSITEKAKEADLVICAGDISNFGDGLQKSLAALESLGKPIVIIHGNHESEKEMEEACAQFKHFIFLHKTAMEQGNYLFLGYGGGGFSQRDKKFEEFSNQFISRMQGKKVILVTHAPPHGTVLDKLSSGYAGSKSIREFIDSHKPVLAVSGHLHDNAGKQDVVSGTIIVNPGPDGKLFEI